MTGTTPLGARRHGRRPRSFRQQIVLLTAGVTAVAMLLLTVVVQLVLAQITGNDADRVLEDRGEAVVSAVGTTTTAGGGRRLTVPDSVLDAGVAVFDDTGRLVAGDVPRRSRTAYETLATTRRVVSGTPSDDVRVRAQPFTLPGGSGGSGGVAGVVVVAGDLGPYEEAERLALVVTLLVGVLITGASAAIAAWSTTRALRPVAEMSSTAADWSERDLTRRFSLGPPTNEITSLAHTLDQLLDKVSTAIRSEQRLTAELAHELRTPLTAIQGTSDLMLLRERSTLSDVTRTDLEEISAASRRMATTITTLLDLARSGVALDSAASCDLAAVLLDARDAASTDTGIEVTVGELPDVRLALPAGLAERTLTPLVENALTFAERRVELTAERTGHEVTIAVVDDGPGVDPTLRDSLFEPGTTSGRGGATGLGLAISRRVARSAGGDVQLLDADSSAGPRGARFVVRLPVV